MNELMGQFIKACRLDFGLNTQRVFAAWDSVSGVSAYTLRRFYRDGVLYITLSSSMVRNQLEFQKDALVSSMNETLRKDEMFMKDCRQVGYVKRIILK